jgi:hypothetical protein
MRRRAAVLLVALAAGLQLPAQAGAAETACFDASVPLTVEEQRLSDPVASRLVREGGFDRLVDGFRSALCATRSAASAQRVVTGAGEELWRTAVDRAQGRLPHMGTLDQYDDRPLYWARLRMSAALRQWSPDFAVPRPVLLTAFSHASRGVLSTTPKPGGTARRALISGFDPFGFGSELRGSNASGAAALRLDGRVLQTPDGPVAVEAALFPVTWRDFDEGILETAFGPRLSSPSRRPDVLMTISQGAGFTVEQWAAGWRDGGPDNNDAGAPGLVPAAAGWPQSPSTLIETTLPVARMIAANTGPDAVWFNQFYCYWPAGTTPGSVESECRFNGERPQPGETGAMGSGGAFLSNESMFRANRLRIGLGADDVRGGHLHISQVGVPADPAALTDEATEASRRAIVDQTSALVGVAATAG